MGRWEVVEEEEEKEFGSVQSSQAQNLKRGSSSASTDGEESKKENQSQLDEEVSLQHVDKHSLPALSGTQLGGEESKGMGNADTHSYNAAGSQVFKPPSSELMFNQSENLAVKLTGDEV